MTITAIPVGDTFMLECDECGPIGTCDHHDVHPAAHAHLAEHGIIV